MGTSSSDELAIQLFGGFRAAVGPRIIHDSDWSLRKAKSLVKLLALTPLHRLHRLQVMDRLWPELEPEAATNNLYKVLHLARRAVEPTLPPKGPSSYLHVRDEFVVLDPPGPLWIDVEAFQAAADVARLGQDPAAYEEALSLYAGDLLPEDRYEDWAIPHRERMKAVRLALLVELADLRLQRGDTDGAIKRLREVVAREPAHEQAQTTLIRLLAETGQRHLAVRQYQQLSDVLRRELGVEPGPDTQAVYRQALSGQLGSAMQDLTVAPGLGATRPLARLAHLPLVGRERELEKLQRTVEMLLAGQGRLMFVSGEAGVGKSRLAAELTERATLVGAVALWGTVYDHENQLPYGPFIVALEGFAIRVAPASLRPLLDGPASALARVGPAIARALGREPEGLRTPEDHERFFVAVSDLFVRLAVCAPLVVVLDNLHAADAGTLDLLYYLARTARDLPALLLSTFRWEEVSPGNQLDFLLETLERERLAELLELPVLSFHETELLARSLLGGPIDRGVLRRIHGLAKGNPYYTEETIAALWGRGEVCQVGGLWRLQDDAALAWDRSFLRRRESCSGDYRLASRLRLPTLAGQERRTRKAK